jgi:ketosteroid isomerase-like protein
MGKFLSCLFTLILAFLIGFGVYSIHSNTLAKNEVLKLTGEFHDAERKKDAEKLKEILGNEISYYRYKDRKIFSKEEFIENIKNIRFEIESIKGNFFSSEVVNNEQLKVYFTMQITFINDDGISFNHVGDYTYTFEKQENQWKLIAIYFEN